MLSSISLLIQFETKSFINSTIVPQQSCHTHRSVLIPVLSILPVIEVLLGYSHEMWQFLQVFYFYFIFFYIFRVPSKGQIMVAPWDAGLLST